VDSFHLPDKIKKTNLQDQANLRSDDKYGLSRRDGTRLIVSSSAVSTAQLWRFFDTSNNEWLIRLDTTGTLSAGKAVTSSSGSFTVVLSTSLSTSVQTDGVQALGKFWFTNKVNGLMSWDTVTFSSYPAAPKAASIDEYKSRLVLGDISNEQSSVRLSGALDGSEWTNDSRFSTSPVSLRIGGVNDGNKVYWVHTALDECLVGKGNSTYALYGNDQRDFGTRIISPEIGSIYPRTVRQHGTRTIMLSNRGLDAYTPPYSFERISDPVQNLIDSLSAAGATAKFQTVDTQAEWSVGTSSPTGNISATLTPGIIKTSNQTRTDTTSLDFSAGTFAAGQNTLSTSIVSNSLVFVSTPNAYLNNGSFETQQVGFSTSPVGWTGFGAFQSTNTSQGSPCSSPNFEVARTSMNVGTAFDPDYVFKSSFTSSINPSVADGSESFSILELLDAGTNEVLVSTVVCTGSNCTLSNASTPGGASSWSTTRLYFDQYKGRYVKLKVRELIQVKNGGFHDGLDTYLMSNSFWAGTSVTVRSYGYFTAIGGGGCPSQVGVYSRLYDGVVVGTRPASDFTPSTFTSAVFDTLVSSPNFDRFAATYVSTDATVGWSVRTASSTDGGCCWGTPVAVATGGVNNVPRLRYEQYIATAAASVSTYPRVASIQDVTLGSWVTGYFQTGVLDFGSNISSFGLFTANRTLNGGSLSFQVNSSVDGVFSEAGWTNQTLDAAVGIPVRRYGAARVFFDLDVSTDNPFVDSLTFNYNEGESAPDPHAVVQGSRYNLFYGTSTGLSAQNDQCLVFNRNDRFDRFSGINASASTVYASKILLGDPGPTGNIFSLDGSITGRDLTGTVTSYFQLQRYGAGNPDSRKVFDRLYVTVSRTDPSVSHRFRVEYSVDGSTTVYNSSEIEISTGTSVSVLKFYFPIKQRIQGRYIDIRVRELFGRGVYYINRARIYGTILDPD
jgi:hypothetical protein